MFKNQFLDTNNYLTTCARKIRLQERKKDLSER